MRAPAGRLLPLLLAPLAAAYGAAVRARNRRFDGPDRAARAPVPVVSVGNLAAGGTGKTPLVAWIARRLLAEGCRPAVVTRGFGGRAGSGPCILSDGAGPRTTWEISGDEPYLLARALPGVPVVVGSDRVAGAGAAVSCGADVVVLDDGFQHRRLARDLDLVLLDSRLPLGNGRLLPAGPLREPPSSLARASALVATRAPDGDPAAVLEIARRHAPGKPVFASSHRPAGFVDARGVETGKPERAVAFCGIGDPVPFLADVERDGVVLLAARVFPDHHPYAPREIRGLARLAARHRAPLLTTEKDLVRLPPEAAAAAGVVARRIEATVREEAAFAALLLRAAKGAAQ